MSKEFVISDLHFGHRNIISYCGRPYKDVSEMDNALVSNWNSVVSSRDTVYVVGDFAFLKRGDPLKRIVESLNGDKLLIRGNHDKLTLSKYKEMGFVNVLPSFKTVYEDKVIFMEHIPKEENSNHCEIYIHGHTHEKDVEWAKPHVFNCCVEKINYTPIELHYVIDKVNSKLIMKYAKAKSSTHKSR